MLFIEIYLVLFCLSYVVLSGVCRIVLELVMSVVCCIEWCL